MSVWEPGWSPPGSACGRGPGGWAVGLGGPGGGLGLGAGHVGARWQVAPDMSRDRDRGHGGHSASGRRLREWSSG
eukprot:3670660-Rhodomonas_salina.2